MAVIFPRWTNWLPLVVLAKVAFGGIAVVGAVWYWFSPEYTDVGYAPVQPVPFSHKFHAGELGLDCRYCHYTVEKSSYAAIPPTSVCMGCHQKMSFPKDSKGKYNIKHPKLAPLLKSVKTGKPLKWVRVHMLPDYAFFNHKVHVAAGVGCASCHGRIDKMEVVSQKKPLSMSWCLDCHRNPNKHLRPRNQVTNMSWDAKKAGYDPTKDATRANREDIKRLRLAIKNGETFRQVDHKKVVVNPPEHCSGCHR